MPVCDVKVFLKADEAASGDEGGGSRDQGWATEQAKEVVSGATLKAHPMIRSVTGSNSRASLPSICIPFIRLNKPVLASVPTPDGAQMSYIANVNEPSISTDDGQPTGQFFPARPKPQRQQIAQ
jgi:hypothetical protein